MKRFKVLPGNLPINNRWNNQHEIFKKYSNSLAQPLLFYSLSMLLSLSLSRTLRWRFALVLLPLRYLLRRVWFDLFGICIFGAIRSCPATPALHFNRLGPLLEFGSSLQLAFLNMLHTFVRCEACGECESGASGATLFRIPVNISITFR